MVGWPSDWNTARSSTPWIVESTFITLFALSVSFCKSLPKILNEFSPLMPETASATLSCRYCDRLKSTPGKDAWSLCSISSVSFSLSTPGRHWSSGFIGAKNSALKKPAASVPSSGRPCWETTRSTSGNEAMILRISLT